MVDYTQAEGFVTDAQGRRQYADRDDANLVQGTEIAAADHNQVRNPLVKAVQRSGQTPDNGNEDQIAIAMDAAAALPAWSQDVAAALGGYPLNAVVCDPKGVRWQSLVPNNTSPPSAGAAWLKFSGGRLLGVKIFTESGTYTPSAGAQFVIVEVQAGGGSGWGCGSVTQSGLVSYGTGGNAGTYAMGLIGWPTQTPVTVGQQTEPGQDNGSFSGGASSFGTLIVCPGGQGGNGVSQATPGVTGMHPRRFPSFDNSVLRICGVGDLVGGQAYVAQPGTYVGGAGGSSRLGAGGGHTSWGASGDAGTGYGAGGSGTAVTYGDPAVTGGYGAPGIVSVWEYT